MKPLLAIALAMLCATPAALAKDKPAFVETGRDYDPLQRRLRIAGWRAVGHEMRAGGQCLESDSRCAKYGEAAACSGTGLGFCDMVWRHQDGTLLTIVTAGETELVVHHWELKRQ